MVADSRYLSRSPGSELSQMPGSVSRSLLLAGDPVQAQPLHLVPWA